MKFKALLLATILSLTSFSVFAEIVNLNKADAAALQHYLKGVGEKKAKNIIAYRKDHKSFKTVAEIMEVKGIGEGIFKKIKMDLSLTKGVVSAPTKTKSAAKTAVKKANPTEKVSAKKEKSKNKVDTSKATTSKDKAPKKAAKVATKKTAKKS